MNYSHARNQRLRYDLEARLERQWAALRDQGHEDCEGWQYDPQEARLICSCGEVVPIEDGADR